MVSVISAPDYCYVCKLGQGGVVLFFTRHEQLGPWTSDEALAQMYTTQSSAEDVASASDEAYVLPIWRST